MNANRELQLSGAAYGLEPGKATPPQGASERFVSVGGNTYRYRRYLKSIGLQWEPVEHAWKGRLSDEAVKPEIYTEIEESEEWQRRHAVLSIDA